jgi:hypothetical protein
MKNTKRLGNVCRISSLANFPNGRPRRGGIIETFLYHLKRYVERVLLFHIFTTPGFSNIRDAAEFLNLPAGLPELQRKIRLMDRALKYHGGP